MSTPQRVVVGAWLAMIGLAAARSLGQSKQLPQPSTFLASAVLFTLLYGAAGIVGPVAAVFAVGTDVAALTLPYFRGQTTGPLDSIAAGLEKLTGAPASSSAAPGGAPAPGPAAGSGGNLTP